MHNKQNKQHNKQPTSHLKIVSLQRRTQTLSSTHQCNDVLVVSPGPKQCRRRLRMVGMEDENIFF